MLVQRLIIFELEQATTSILLLRLLLCHKVILMLGSIRSKVLWHLISIESSSAKVLILKICCPGDCIHLSIVAIVSSGTNRKSWWVIASMIGRLIRFITARMSKHTVIISSSASLPISALLNISLQTLGLVSELVRLIPLIRYALVSAWVNKSASTLSQKGTIFTF